VCVGKALTDFGPWGPSPISAVGHEFPARLLDRIRDMPPTSSPGSVRPAAVVNEEIRALVEQAGGWLYGETRQQYQVLRDEWADAVRVEGAVVEAA
jgi:hypothetical protein